MSSSPLIHIWIPDCESVRGGIQVFSRFFIRAVGECLPEAELFVFSKNDRWLSKPLVPQVKKVRCAGRWPQHLRTAAFTWQLVTNALRHRPDLILTTHTNFTPVAAWLKKIRGIPFAAVAHGVEVWGVPGQKLRHGLLQADAILAVSRLTRDRLLKGFTLASDRVRLLPNTFESKQFKLGPKPCHLLERFGLKPGQPVILTVARLAGAGRCKGYDRVLRALPEIRRMVPDVHYLLGGKGPDRGRIEELVRELKLEDAVTLAGYIPNHELCDFYNLCDVFAMPGKNEGFGIVFLEALACGKPVLAGNQDGSVDPLIDGELGVLVNPDNVSEIVSALTAMLNRRHPLAILQQPEHLRQRVFEVYGYQKFVENLAAQLVQLGFQKEPQPREIIHNPCVK
ncbi:MAG: glycosyltransferase family 4 protein [Verrucomicrobiota bacterium]